jgi:hypothetical protein
MPAMDNAHALVVGIAHYRYISPLSPTVLDDARDIRDILIDPALGGYPPENVRLLLDQEATLTGLRGALADLAQRCDAESTALVYVSSHGGRVQDGPHAGEYLLPVDADIAEPATTAATAISGAELTTALRAIPARKLLVIFDCCHAGGIGQPKAAQAAVMKAGLPDDLYARLQEGRGRVILASSEDGEYSWVLDGARNSLFTEHLLAGLRGGAASEDGLVTIFDLFEYVQPRVTGTRKTQHPVFKADLRDNFPVALYRGGQQGVVPKADDGFIHDAYISYTDRDSDYAWVWDTLVPKLKAAGVKVAVSGDSLDLGVPRVVSVERGIQQARRIVVVHSEAYKQDHAAEFENVLAQDLGMQEGTYRVVPIRLDAAEMPPRLGMLVSLDMTRPARVEREFERLVRALTSPLPRR